MSEEKLWPLEPIKIYDMVSNGKLIFVRQVFMLRTVFFLRNELSLYTGELLYLSACDFSLPSLHGTYLNQISINSGTAVAQRLRCCATNQKVAGLIPAGVSGFFIDIKSFRSHYGPGVDSASNRNEYQEHFMGVKAAGA